MADSNAGHSIAPEGFAGEAEETADDRSRMSFLEHLDELRRRILYSIYALAACFAVAFWFWDEMYAFLVQYFVQNAVGTRLIYSQPMAGFMFSLKIAGLAALIAASPFIFSQVWLFVAPGLYAREKKIAIPFVFFSSLLFMGGAVFAHLVAFPMMWRFFASYQLNGVEFLPTLDLTLSLYIKVIVGLGVIFQMPVLVFVLARFGVVTAGFLWRKIKYAILIIVIVAAVATPSADIATLLVFAGPMFVLYLVSILVAWMFGKKRKTEAEG
ncbi:MAG TPA: twin-arginine translocase subunit TatC [Vicinamibacterales bacterium]|nr:twin-arginine translocase subunit TatC [Vicinamibacterales bacterium]